jgi:hypothetical protein
MPPAPRGDNTRGASTSHQAHGRGDESSVVRMRSSMMQGPPAPLDDHQGTILEPLSITLAYPLTIHRVLATLGRYSNLMEPAIPSGRTRWRSI